MYIFGEQETWRYRNRREIRVWQKHVWQVLESNLTCRSINKRRNIRRIKSSPGNPLWEREKEFVREYISDRSRRLPEKRAHRPLPIGNVSLVLSSGPTKSRTDLGSSHSARPFVFPFYQYVTHDDRFVFLSPCKLHAAATPVYPIFRRTKITTRNLANSIHSEEYFRFVVRHDGLDFDANWTG